MSQRIHHLNCGTMCPLCQRLMNDRNGSWTEPGEFVCHCLLVETANSLVLVDTGMGTLDIEEPRRRLGPVQPAVFRPKLLLEETALHQVRALGHDPSDVRHIITTHLDVDHAGGLADFPEAAVHVLQPELDQVLKPTLKDRLRFQQAQFEHGPDWVVHEEHGEEWFGFSAIQPIPDVSFDILMIPLIGHTRGHVGVAVRDGERWLLHCGDAYYHHSQVTANPEVPDGSMFFQKSVAALPAERLRNLARLQELALVRPDEVALFCAHDPVELQRYTD